MAKVTLHIYDVTNRLEKTNSTVVHINKIFKDGIGLGGIFHSALQVYGDDEWSFGFCEEGTGVFSCPSGKNPMFTYRKSLVVGKTNYNIFKLPLGILTAFMIGWVNRFANAGDIAMEAALRIRQAKTEIVSASKVAYRFLLGVTNNVKTGLDSTCNSNRGGSSPRVQAAWLKKLIANGAKPSSSSEAENLGERLSLNNKH
ncbi:PPPDE putative peptidase domain [Sesbania bispinosa]|nr:PPPDE putative peptidase domain [Sesbania bispinosa]